MVKNQIDDQKCRQESCNANWFVRIREFALQILQINHMSCGGAMIYCIKRKGGRLFSGNLLIKCPDFAYFNKLIVLREPQPFIDEVIWTSNSKFILAGGELDSNNNRIPLIYLGDTIQQTIREYTNSNTACIQKTKGYISFKLKRLRIREM